MSVFDWQTVSSTFLTVAMGTLIRSVILALLCAGPAWLLRSRSAALRFALWKWNLLALFALPLLASLTPPVPKAARPITQSRQTRFTAAAIASIQEEATGAVPGGKRHMPIKIIPAVALLVALLLTARLLYNLRQLRRIAAGSETISEQSFRELAQQLWLHSGAKSRPRFGVSREVNVPVTFSTAGESWILLPLQWTEWEHSRLRAVLAHELAHVARNDGAILLLASVATCLFWFHPLSWFLQRQLSRLAEEACDEVVLASNEATPEEYAQFLICFAEDVRRRRGRVAVAATAVVRKPNLQRRLERLFVIARPLQQWLLGVFLALFVSTLYLMAAARFHEPQEQMSSKPWPDSNIFGNLSAEKLTQLQAAVAANPEDIDSRMELFVYFAYRAKDKPFTEQMLWFIEHHPAFEGLIESPIFSPTARLSAASLSQLRSAWEGAIQSNSDSVPVLLNAATFIERTDQSRSVELFRQAVALARPVRRTQIRFEIAYIYAAAEMKALSGGMLNNIDVSPGTGERLRAELEASRDPELLTEVGRTLVDLDYPLGDHAQQRRGLELIGRAVQIDPTRSEWKDALQKSQLARAWADTNPPAVQGTAVSIQRSGLMLGPAEAEANLVSRPEVVYPAAARAARKQGIVEFTITVGTEGTVTQIQLVRGDPALVEEAREVVLKSVY
jgi:beta-lactamase regulating signal transducer with metallopeptidase domain